MDVKRSGCGIIMKRTGAVCHSRMKSARVINIAGFELCCSGEGDTVGSNVNILLSMVNV